MNVRSIFGRSRAFGCGSLSRHQVDRFLEGGLDESTWVDFQGHARSCNECRHLADALEIFRELLEDGVMATERAAFERSERTLRARLRQELERLPSGSRGFFRGAADLSCEELEQIAAAGPQDPKADDGIRDDDATDRDPDSGR
jgi:hypothetical protein